MCKTLRMNIRHVICLPEIKATFYNCKILFRASAVFENICVNR